MENAQGGSAERELATPETAVKEGKKKPDQEAPSAKEFDTETDKNLSPDQEAMQPDSS